MSTESHTKTLSATANPWLFDAHAVRTAMDACGNPWFCAKDVCAVLDIQWSGRGNTLKSVPETWQGVSYHETPGGIQEMVFISEPAVYKLIFRSSKPEAERFANWVCAEVLPAIRRQGYFGALNPKDRLSFTRQISALAERMASNKDALVHQLLAYELRDLCNWLGREPCRILACWAKTACSWSCHYELAPLPRLRLWCNHCGKIRSRDSHPGLTKRTNRAWRFFCACLACVMAGWAGAPSGCAGSLRFR